MARTKTRNKTQYQHFPNCFDVEARLAGRWSDHFGNDNPITLELGCGRADLSYAMAKAHPERNFIGIDVKPVRMWHSAKRALEEGVQNIAFLHIHLLWLAEYFAEKEVADLWITFPDPFPKTRQEKHRMITTAYLEQYRKVLALGGSVQFKTDNLPLFHFALEVFVRSGNVALDTLSFDLHNDLRISEEAKYLTQYERMFMADGLPIKYTKFGFLG